ncbi:MAG: hypothetical protein DRQ78_03340 [Epsilonproteobacteria bacterium]|nr:MAG: hypothetical protein DRQ78_03340 [Campylobacterota bacterium]
MIISIVVAVIAGILTNLFDLKDKKPKNIFSETASPKIGQANFSLARNNETYKCAENFNSKKYFSFSRVIKYAFLTLLKDIAKPLLWGLILRGSTSH